MAVRLVVQIPAVPGRSAEFIRAFKERCDAVRKEPGCEQYEIFQSVEDPDRLVLLERWRDQAALDEHARVTREGPPFPPGLRAAPGEREDYTYHRVR